MALNPTSRLHCLRCTRPQNHCLCALIPYLDSRTRILLLQHSSEVKHPLNTARLAMLGLRNATLLVGETFDTLPILLAQEHYQACLLFPGETAQQLVQNHTHNDAKPLLLVVPDGTWRKARKILHMNPVLATLPRVTLPTGLVSRYRLRKASAEGAVSTLEAIVCALNILEAPCNFDALLRPFEALINGQIAAMGDDVFLRNYGEKEQLKP